MIVNTRAASVSVAVRNPERKALVKAARHLVKPNTSHEGVVNTRHLRAVVTTIDELMDVNTEYVGTFTHDALRGLCGVAGEMAQVTHLDVVPLCTLIGRVADALDQDDAAGQS